MSCDSGEPHQIPTGTALDPATHSCNVKSVADILLPCLTSPAHTLRTRLCWSCSVCQQTYRGTTSACNKEACKGKAGTTYNGVAKRFTEVVSVVAGLGAPLWTQKDQDFPEVLSPIMLCELLLTPHGNQLSGLQHGSWTLQEDEGKCSCLPLKAPEPLSSSTSEAMEVVDEPEVIFASQDIREKEKKGIKLTIRLNKKNKKKKKKSSRSSPAPSPVRPASHQPSNPPSRSSSQPPIKPSSKSSKASSAPVKPASDLSSNPSNTTSSKPSTRPASKPSSRPSSKLPNRPSSKPTLATRTLPQPTPTTKVSEKVPAVNLPSKPPTTPTYRRGVALLPTPPPPKKLKLSSNTTPSPATPTKSTASAKNTIPAEAIEPEDEERSSKAKGNPESWGLWWCWIQECGYVNYMPQDWCKHCGHSKYAKEGNVHLNNLKRKISEMSKTPE